MIIIPIGTNCSPTFFLKFYNIRKESHIFDWDFTLSLKTINSILNDNDRIKSYKNVSDIFHKNLYKIYSSLDKHKNIFLKNNIHQGLIFRHFDIRNKSDFKIYKRRLNKLEKNLQNNKNKIVFIRFLKLDNEIIENFKKMKITCFDNCNDKNIDKLNNNIRQFFKILKKKYNRSDDILILQSKNNNFNEKIIKLKNVKIFCQKHDVFEYLKSIE